VKIIYRFVSYGCILVIVLSTITLEHRHI